MLVRYMPSSCVRLCDVGVAYRRLSDWTRLQLELHTAQLAHAAGESIFCREGQTPRGSSQMTLERTLLLLSGLILNCAGWFVFAVVGEVELTVRPFEGEFYRALGSAVVLTCQLELTAHEHDGDDVPYTIQWFDLKNNSEITDMTGRLVLCMHRQHCKQLY